MPRFKEVAHLLNEWTPTLINQVEDKPAELYDAHPLSEMMISAETESILASSLIRIENNWRSEWHKNGVQVPVNQMDELKKPVVKYLEGSKHPRRLDCATLSEKMLHEASDSRYDETIHQLCSSRSRTTAIYQLDNEDRAWLSIVNEERECLDSPIITEALFEQLMETLEHLMFVKIHERSKELEVQALEFDENAKCDICLSYEGEDGNELVFCDGCLLCVHQACYGILQLPEGSWICRQCEAGVKSTTPCALCPNTGGAMKMTDDRTQWCHISCALWIPEVGFGDFELVEPIVRINEIPQARRNLICVICRSRCGAPIQCSKKTCRIAFHVTCAFQSNLTMRQELSNKDVHLLGFCPKHSRKDPLQNLSNSPNRDLMKTIKRTPTKITNSSNNVSMTSTTYTSHSNPPSSLKQRLLELENNFHTLLDDKELQFWLLKGSLVHESDNDTMPAEGKVKKKIPNNNKKSLKISDDIRLAVTAYWRLKRRSNFNQPLVDPPPFEWLQTVSRTAESTKEAMAAQARATADLQAFGAFRRIRFGLDRSRLVADMVLQRERKKSLLFRKMWQIFELQSCLLKRKSLLSHVSMEDWQIFSTAHLGNSIHDNWHFYKSCRQQNKSTTNASVAQTSDFSSNTSRKSIVTANKSPQKTKASSVQEITTEESVNSILNPINHDFHIIPYENLIVPEDMKQRLRSALDIISINPIHSSLRNPLISSKLGCRGRQKRLPENLAPNANSKPVENGSEFEFCRPPLPKRVKYSTNAQNSPIPILSKLASIRLSSSALPFT